MKGRDTLDGVMGEEHRPDNARDNRYVMHRRGGRRPPSDSALAPNKGVDGDLVTGNRKPYVHGISRLPA
jgi:hypothetical protein